MTAQQIADALEAALPRWTLRYRLKSPVEGQRLILEGNVRWARYRAPQVAQAVGMVLIHPSSVSIVEAILGRRLFPRMSPAFASHQFVPPLLLSQPRSLRLTRRS